MMTDFELDHEIRGGSEDAVAELAVRRQARLRIRGIDPQAKLIAHHRDATRPEPGAAVRGTALPRTAAPGPRRRPAGSRAAPGGASGAVGPP
jgi:hypothetical protein